MEYEQFINNKAVSALHTDSIQVNTDDLNPMLYDFQKDIVRWALAKGRAAIFADCGLGKTPMQLEWANWIVKKRGGMVLILAPLAVASQTAAEGAMKFEWKSIFVKRLRIYDRELISRTMKNSASLRVSSLQVWY